MSKEVREGTDTTCFDELIGQWDYGKYMVKKDLRLKKIDSCYLYQQRAYSFSMV